MNCKKYTDKLKTELSWWLNSRKSFIINDEYQLELIAIDHKRNNVKIKITNIKSDSPISKNGEEHDEE